MDFDSNEQRDNELRHMMNRMSRLSFYNRALSCIDDDSEEELENAEGGAAGGQPAAGQVVAPVIPSPGPGPDPLIYAEQQINVVATNKDIARLLECPVCYSIMLPPITVCSEGHSICDPCRKREKKCPTCRRCFTDIRNRFCEKLLEMCSIQCKYNGFGCKAQLLGSELSNHQQNCGIHDWQQQSALELAKGQDTKEQADAERDANVEDKSNTEEQEAGTSNP